MHMTCLPRAHPLEPGKSYNNPFVSKRNAEKYGLHWIVSMYGKRRPIVKVRIITDVYGLSNIYKY